MAPGGRGIRSAVMMMKGKLSADERPRMRPWYRFCRFWAQALFAGLLRGRVFNANYVPRTGGVLLVSNHQSTLDPVLATVALPRECHYVARDTLFRNPHFRRLIESLNAFPIRRGESDLRAIKEMLRRLKAGYLVNVYPEGTRTRDGAIGPMLPGAIVVARKAGVPIVPCLILGAYEVWPREARWPRLRPVIIAYDRPIWPAEMKGMTDQACIDAVRERLLALQRRFQDHMLLKK